MKIGVLTGHTPGGRRRASVLAMAEALSAQNEVSVVRVGSSLVHSFLNGRSGDKHAYPLNRPYRSSQLTGYIAHPLIHPFNLRIPILNRLSTPLFRLYPRLIRAEVWDMLAEAQVLLCESGLGLFLIPELARRNPQQKRIYSVSDRLVTLRPHPLVLEAEREALPYFHKIRVPAHCMLDDYRGFPVDYIPQGIAKAAFEDVTTSPFKNSKNVVVVGDMLFDSNIVVLLARRYPDWSFHLFGRKARLGLSLPNVIEHGEVEFSKIAAYIKFADIGLAPYRPAPNAEYLSQSSLKMVQYTYCGLPILAPDFAAAGRENVISYQPSAPDSALGAFERATSQGRRAAMNSSLAVKDWNEIAEFLVGQTLKVQENA